MRITPEAFVETWQRAKDISEVIEKLNMSYNTATVRAHYYRKKGIPLKTFTKSKGVSLNIPELKELALSTLTINQQEV